MIKYLFLAVMISLPVCISAQDRLVKDIDNDSIKDTVYIDRGKSVIVCSLSSMKFKTIQSGIIGVLDEQTGINGTKNGFEFYVNWMRAGFKAQFRYEAHTKKIKLIGMSRYEFGNALNDGSGQSSVNLLTGDYIGTWNFFDNEKNVLIQLPAIKTKMAIPETFLEKFTDDVYGDYAGKCSELYDKRKSQFIQTGK